MQCSYTSVLEQLLKTLSSDQHTESPIIYFNHTNEAFTMTEDSVSSLWNFNDFNTKKAFEKRIESEKNGYTHP